MQLSAITLTILLNQAAIQQAAIEQTPDASNQTVERIEVRASGLGRDVIEMAGPVTVLSGDELTLRGESSIGETLKFEPGVHGNYFGPVASSPVIRGLDGARVQVVHNGMGTGDVSREGPDHTITADALTAQQIEILRGPATLLYGSGAIGGVINVVDNRIPRSVQAWPETVVQARYNTAAGERALSFAHDSSMNSWAVHADGYLRDSNDYRVPNYTNEEGASSSRLNNSWSEHTNFNFGTSYVAERGFVGVSYGYIASEYGLPEGPDLEPDDHGEFINLNQRRVALAAEYRPILPIWERVNADIAYTDYDHAEIDDGVPETEFTSRAIELRTSGTYVLPQGWRGIIGYHGFSRDYQALGEEAFTPNTDTDSHAVFWLQERQFGAVKGEIGARYERLTQRAEAVTDALGVRDIDDPFNLFSWSLGAVYQLSPSHQLTASFSRAERAPAANELYANGVHIGTRSYEIGTAYRVNSDGQIISDASLSKIERANNLDLGVRGQYADFSYQVNLFYNQIEDFAYLRNLGFELQGLPAYQYTQQDVTLHGAEASLTWRFSANQQVQLMGDVIRARIDRVDSGERNLPRIPPHRLGAEYRYTAQQWVATLGVHQFASQQRVAENETPTSSYHLVEASVQYDFQWLGSDMMWFAKLHNASNQLAFVHSSFIKEDAPLPGRNLTLGIQARF